MKRKAPKISSRKAQKSFGDWRPQFGKKIVGILLEVLVSREPYLTEFLFSYLTKFC